MREDIVSEGPEARRAGLRSVWIGLGLALVAYLALVASPVLQVTDSRYALLVSEAVLRDKSLALDSFFPPHVDSRAYPEIPPGERYPRHVRLIDGHVHYFFPPGTSLLAVPLVAAGHAAGIDVAGPAGRFRPAAEERLQRIGGALCGALACLLLFALARQMLPDGWSALVALAFTFGTQVWSTASRGLSSQAPLVPLTLLLVVLLLRAESRSRAPSPAGLALLIALSFLVRPLSAITSAGFLLYVFFRWPARRRSLVLWLLGFAAAFVAGSFAVYGRALPPYYARGDAFSLTTLHLGLAANLVSPARGLFVYVPLALLALGLVWTHRARLPHRGLAICALSAALLHLLIVSAFENWWAGVSYGPRFLTDLVPIGALLFVLGLAAARARRPRPSRLEVAAWILVLVPSLVLNGAGAISPAGIQWNSRPVSIPHDRMRVFDWRNPPFAVALFPSRLPPAQALPWRERQRR